MPQANAKLSPVDSSTATVPRTMDAQRIKFGTKRLELLKEILPRLARVAVLWNSNNVGVRLQVKEVERAAPVLGIKLQSLPLADAIDLEQALQAAAQARELGALGHEVRLMPAHYVKAYIKRNKHDAICNRFSSACGLAALGGSGRGSGAKAYVNAIRGLQKRYENGG
jgi:hypothetical protein